MLYGRLVLCHAASKWNESSMTLGVPVKPGYVMQKRMKADSFTDSGQCTYYFAILVAPCTQLKHWPCSCIESAKGLVQEAQRMGLDRLRRLYE